MKLKKNNKFIVAADGAAASGKTTGSKIISRKYGLKFLSSGLLYRYAGQQLLKYNPKNKIKFLKLKFKNLNYKKTNKPKSVILLTLQFTIDPTGDFFVTTSHGFSKVCL